MSDIAEPLFVDIETAPLPIERVEHVMGAFDPDAFDFESLTVNHLKDILSQFQVDHGARDSKGTLVAIAKLNENTEQHILALAKETHREKLLSKAALSPYTGRVIALGMRDPDGKPIIISSEVEGNILEVFFKELNNRMLNNGGNLVGFNFHDFDLPFLLTRARLLRVPTGTFDFRSMKQFIVDVYKEHICWVSQATKAQLFPKADLKTMAKVYGVSSFHRENECSGAEFAEFISSDDPLKVEQAQNHLYADLEETQSLYYFVK